MVLQSNNWKALKKIGAHAYLAIRSNCDWIANLLCHQRPFLQHLQVEHNHHPLALLLQRMSIVYGGDEHLVGHLVADQLLHLDHGVLGQGLLVHQMVQLRKYVEEVYRTSNYCWTWTKSWPSLLWSLTSFTCVASMAKLLLYSPSFRRRRNLETPLGSRFLVKAGH